MSQLCNLHLLFSICKSTWFTHYLSAEALLCELYRSPFGQWFFKSMNLLCNPPLLFSICNSTWFTRQNLLNLQYLTTWNHYWNKLSDSFFPQELSWKTKSPLLVSIIITWFTGQILLNLQYWTTWNHYWNKLSDSLFLGNYNGEQSHHC